MDCGGPIRQFAELGRGDRRGRRAEVAMEALQARLLDAGLGSFDEFPAPLAIVAGAGYAEWPGRYWLPDGDRVEPAGRFCLFRGDGGVGEMLMDRFEVSEIERTVAI
jgi:hypothetical protein